MKRIYVLAFLLLMACHSASVYRQDPDIKTDDIKDGSGNRESELYHEDLQSPPKSLSHEESTGDQPGETDETNLNTLGMACYRNGDLEKAASYFQTAVRLDPRDAEAFVNLGIVYKKQNKFSDAVDVYKRAMYLKPYAPEPHFNLGVLYDDMEDYDKAVGAYRRFLELATEMYAPQKSMVRQRLTAIQSHLESETPRGLKPEPKTALEILD